MNEQRHKPDGCHGAILHVGRNVKSSDKGTQKLTLESRTGRNENQLGSIEMGVGIIQNCLGWLLGSSSIGKVMLHLHGYRIVPDIPCAAVKPLLP